MTNNTSGKAEPKYTNISVFDIVPITSFPIFIPEVITVSPKEFGLFHKISLMALAIETPVSISAPSAAIIIEADKKVRESLNQGALNIKTCFLLPQNLSKAKYMVKRERAPAKTRLRDVPIIAEELFELSPPTR